MKSWLVVRLFFFSAQFCFLCTAIADEKIDRIENLFLGFDRGKQPGVAVLVMQGEQVFYAKGFGYADLEKEIKIDTHSMFRLASVSKQFTTMAIMRLAEAGHLAYDDMLADHVPQLNHWPGVTIRHLMNHTSGVPDYYELGHYTDFLERYDETITMPQNSNLIGIMSNYINASFEPGEQYEYNNAAYELLTLVVESVSGSTFKTFVEEDVFEPAGMATATVFNTANGAFANRVLGYSPTEDGFAANDFDPFNDMLGAGSLYASLLDFVKWSKSLNNYALVSRRTMSEALSQTRLNDGTLINYGFGWSIESFRGHINRSHTGSWVGFRTAFRQLSELGLSIVVLSNRSDVNALDLVDAVSDVMIDSHGMDFAGRISPIGHEPPQTNS